MRVALIPVLVLGVLTLILRLSSIDVALCRHFYDSSVPYPWRWGWSTPCDLLYTYGVYPAWVLFGVGCLLLAANVRRRRFDRGARCGLFLVLVLGLGPGLLVSLVLKPGYGRPRPRDLVEFGGQHEFVPVLTPTPSLGCTSFPSGHAAMGFYLMVPAFLFERRSRRTAVLFVLIGLLLGGAVGFVRILQGGHFASDVLWSAGVVYFTAFIVASLLRPSELEDEESGSVSSGGVVA